MKPRPRMGSKENFVAEVRDCYLPDDSEMVSGVLFVSLKYGAAKHLCPCGCGNVVVTQIGKPHGWSLKLDGRTPTLSSSIWSPNLPCNSHYFIRNGRVVWA